MITLLSRFLTTLLGLFTAWSVAAAYRRGRAAREADHWPAPPPPDRWPEATVIVPAWKERGTVEILMRSLRALDYPAWEAVVVAGGPDGTYEAARAAAGDPRITVIEQRPRGKNGALNDGLAFARGEVIAILDADAQIGPGWLRAMVAPLCAGAAASTGTYFPLRPTPFALHGQMEKIAVNEIRGQVFLQGSGGIALRREVIEAIGGFPEDVLVGVDWDLDARVAMAGFPRAYCPGAVIHTERPATLAEWWHNDVRWRRAHLASLFRLRQHFLGTPRAALGNLYPYLLGWLCVGATLLAAASAVAAPPPARQAILSAWATLVAWAGLSPVALAVEVAAFTGDPRWLRLAWTPSLLWGVTLAAACTASLTPGAATMHFKGPRHQIERALTADKRSGAGEAGLP